MPTRAANCQKRKNDELEIEARPKLHEIVAIRAKENETEATQDVENEMAARRDDLAAKQLETEALPVVIVDEAILEKSLGPTVFIPELPLLLAKNPVPIVFIPNQIEALQVAPVPAVFIPRENEPQDNNQDPETAVFIPNEKRALGHNEPCETKVFNPDASVLPCRQEDPVATKTQIVVQHKQQQLPPPQPRETFLPNVPKQTPIATVIPLMLPNWNEAEVAP